MMLIWILNVQGCKSSSSDHIKQIGHQAIWNLYTERKMLPTSAFIFEDEILHFP